MHLFYATKLLLDFIAIIINKLLDYICINNISCNKCFCLS